MVLSIYESTKLINLGMTRATLAERFWAKVDKSSDCWEWTAAKTPAGYGVLTVDRVVQYAHRISYSMANGDIPASMKVDHVCHNPSCVNPNHLRLATNKENAENHSGPISTNTSGYRGVYWLKSRSRWVVEVKHADVKYRGGSFKTIEEANQAAIDLRNSLFTRNDIDRTAA